MHKTVIVPVTARDAFGVNYFDSIRTGIKRRTNRWLVYGYSWLMTLLKFEFTHKDGKPFQKYWIQSIKRVATNGSNDGNSLSRNHSSFLKNPEEEAEIGRQAG